MKCQRCGYADAMVHIQDFPSPDRKGIWLCPRCSAVIHGQPDDARDREDLPSFSDPVGAAAGGMSRTPVEPFMGHVFNTDDPFAARKVRSCDTCRLTLEEFSKDGLLGCADCYTVFKDEVLALLHQTQPHVYHLGKVPSGGLSGQDIGSQLARVRIALEEAVAAEEYEKAATLRDQIHDLEQVDDSGQGLS